MKFEFTVEGHEKAVKYLKLIGKYGKVTREDGYTVVEYANRLYSENE